MTRTELVAELEKQQQELEVMLATTTEAALGKQVWHDEEHGQGWSVKDVLAHIVTWKSNQMRAVDVLQQSGVSPDETTRVSLLLEIDVNEFNSRTMAERRDAIVTELTDEVKAAHAKLMEYVASLPDEALLDDSGERLTWLRASTDHIADHLEQARTALNE